MHMMRKIVNARNQGFTQVAAVHFVAEKKCDWRRRERYTLMEFIPGHTLATEPIDAALRAEVKNLVQQLHNHGLISGSLHLRNFIRLPDGSIKAIDLSGRSATARRKAKDRMDMEVRLGIKNEVEDWGYWLETLAQKKRELKRHCLAHVLGRSRNK